MTVPAMCRVCNATFLDQFEVAGQLRVCPACRDKGVAALQAIQPGGDTSLTSGATSRAQWESAGPGQLGKLFALNAGIDLNEESKSEVQDLVAAHGEWRTALPEVPSAYQPSGALPASALISMTLGAGVGATLATLVELVAGSLARVVIFLLIALAAMLPFFFFKSCWACWE